MKRDYYDNPLSTSSDAARDAYVRGMTSLLAAQADMADGFRDAIAADPGFALGHAGLARACQFTGDAPAAQAAIAQARALTSGLSAREAGHIHALGLLIDGKGPQAYAAIRAHVDQFPRDAIVAQTCSSVFGLIGFSGQPGREAETLAYTAALLPHYGEDWWALSQYAFALCETGRLDKAGELIDRSLALNPQNANAAHVRSHVSYETGDTLGGIEFLTRWLSGYSSRGVMHGHLSWHVALWSLQQGDVEAMWAYVDAAVTPPGATHSLPINIVTDTASILHRAELAGVAVAPERWAAVSTYAARHFPQAGNAFIDVHAALAHAMAGNSEALHRIITEPAGPAADLVPDLATAYERIAQGRWEDATDHLTRAMADLARIGGSRAQRDLVEHSLLASLMRQGRDREARAVAALRRPVLAETLAA